jgi:hypothetical protein
MHLFGCSVRRAWIRFLRTTSCGPTSVPAIAHSVAARHPMASLSGMSRTAP